jgi:hypothetical protein
VAEHLLRSPIGAGLATDGRTVVGVITAADVLGALSRPLLHPSGHPSSGATSAGAAHH